MAKDARGLRRGLAGLGLQVAPVTGFSTRGQGQQRCTCLWHPLSLPPLPRTSCTGSILSIQGPRDVVIATNSHRLADLGEGGERECRAAVHRLSLLKAPYRRQGTATRVPRYTATPTAPASPEQSQPPPSEGNVISSISTFQRWGN